MFCFIQIKTWLLLKPWTLNELKTLPYFFPVFYPHNPFQLLGLKSDSGSADSSVTTSLLKAPMGTCEV